MIGELFNHLFGLIPESVTGLSFFQGIPDVGLIIIFMIFVVIAFKVFKMVLKIVSVGIVAAVFPFFANYFMAMAIPVTFQTLATYALLGMFICFVYLGAKTIYKVVSWPFRGRPRTVVKKVYVKDKNKKK